MPSASIPTRRTPSRSPRRCAMPWPPISTPHDRRTLRRRRLYAGLADAIEEDGANDDAAEQDLLDVPADLQQVHRVRQHGDEDGAQYDRDDAADAALQADAADDGRGDALEHQAAAEIGLARPGPRRQHQRAERREQTAGDVRERQV